MCGPHCLSRLLKYRQKRAGSLRNPTFDIFPNQGPPGLIQKGPTNELLSDKLGSVGGEPLHIFGTTLCAHCFGPLTVVSGH